jgi:beta-N-acetylhexosaminidase
MYRYDISFYSCLCVSLPLSAVRIRVVIDGFAVAGYNSTITIVFSLTSRHSCLRFLPPPFAMNSTSTRRTQQQDRSHVAARTIARRRLLRLGVPLLWIIATLVFLFWTDQGSGQRLLAQEVEDPLAPTATMSPAPLLPDVTLSAPTPTLTATNEIRANTVLITATIWAKVTATAQAIEALTTTPVPLEGTPPAPTPSPTPGPDQILEQQIDDIIAQMSVAERVGQLFVIDFEGNQVSDDSDIAEFIQDYRIGGVVLSAQNGNFDNSDPSAPRRIAELTNQLQALAYDVILPAEQALNPPDVLLRRPQGLAINPLQQAGPQIPLLIGAEQNGDGLPATALRGGFTTLPPQMALGATWNPTLVESVGEVVGRELAAVGINLLLGPNLDVQELLRPESVGGVGIYTFGGDAFWVGKLGKAYVQGVHNGGQGRVATIAGHFPGQGGSDRRVDEEVATIQKSLQELRRIELLPFANVTQRASAILRTDGDPTATDGLMSGHIRYSSFQGSRERTPPISLAKELTTILELEEFAAWRQGGGLVMSSALGVPSIRRYYDPTLEEFPRKRVALDAFLAGNDLLYLSRFSIDDNWESSKNNIRETILFFRERYSSDADFAIRVDESLRRILRLKLRLYTQDQTYSEAPFIELPLSDVLVDSRSLRVLSGTSRENAQSVIGQVAREALTILYPDPRGLADPLPAAPQSDEKILIISDSRPVQECSGCVQAPAIAPTALEEAMLRLYGPQATGQLTPDQLTSITFEQLAGLLNETISGGEASRLEDAINQADWIIFAMLDVDVARYQSSDAVKQFLRLRSDRLRSKDIVVLALNAPYFLDSTEISKLTAYLGVYSKTQPFLEAAVRAIFRAIPVPGSPPVNVPGTRYSSLIDRLEPDPDQTIELYLLNDDVIPNTSQNGGQRVERIEADLTIGDLIFVETSTIIDHNGRPVPDGTQVNFRLIYEGEELALPIDPVSTRAGKARISVPLERGGTLRISAGSVEATVSTIVLVSTQGENQAAQIEFVMPTPTPEPVLLASAGGSEAAAEVTANPQEGVAAADTEGMTLRVVPPRTRVNVLTLALALITQLVMLGLLLVVLVRVMPRAMLVYRLLWALLVGWVAYIFYGLGLIPGSGWLQMTLYPWGIIPVVFIGMLLPLVWLQLRLE